MASYELFKSSIEEAEGGYQNLKSDPGNYNSLGQRVGTNHGISAKFYEAVRGMAPSVEDMKAISKQEAHILFKNEFWDKVKADNIDSQAVAETLADHAINAGVGTAGKVMQITLNTAFHKNLLVDGKVGRQTLAAMNSVNEKELFQAFSLARLEDYKTKRNYSSWGRIWERRVQALGKKFGIEIKKKSPSF